MLLFAKIAKCFFKARGIPKWKKQIEDIESNERKLIATRYSILLIFIIVSFYLRISIKYSGESCSAVFFLYSKYKEEMEVEENGN